MLAGPIFTILFVLLFGILLGLQAYFSHRMRQAAERAQHDETARGEAYMSHRASFRFALFLITYHLFLMAWVIYNVTVESFPKFVGIAFIPVWLILIRKPVTLAIAHRPISARSTIDLAIPPIVPHVATPDFIAEMLGQEEVIRAVRNDLAKTGHIGRQETWRLGVLVPGRDQFDPRIFQLSRQEILGRMVRDPRFRANAQGRVPVERTAILHSATYFRIRLNNLLIAQHHGLRSYRLSTRARRGELTRIRDIQIDEASAAGKSPMLPQFLRENGFPLKEWYADGDPLTTERGGTIVSDRGRMIVIYPQYFVQRRLVDDEGNLIYVGLDEGSVYDTVLGIGMQPSTSRLLIRCVSRNEHIPIVRYRSFPYASDLMLALLDTPMSASGWADLFIDTRGKARLFVAKEKTEAEWVQMMDRLKQLFYDELSRANYHLLGLTKDETHLNEYLQRKQAILADYFTIHDLVLA